MTFPKILNVELVSNPFNWVIVFLVLYFAALLAHMVAAAASDAPIKLPKIAGLGNS